MVRILYTKYQFHILNASKDIVHTRRLLCPQGFSIAIMAESKKGRNFAIIGPTEKNTRSLIFVLMFHIKFRGSTQVGFKDKVGT